MNKKLTILHANDIHGQLQFSVNKDLEIQGGISLMSGYIKRVRAELPAVFFQYQRGCAAGGYLRI